MAQTKNMPKFKKYPKYPLYKETPKGFSGFKQKWQKVLPVLKRKDFYLEKRTVGGDAPKSFIRVYEYGQDQCRRDKPSTWIPYIAKVGHKWYPCESITEFLMNQIGEALDIQMAASKLIVADDQIRFLSKYFLNLEQHEQLVHGAQIYSGYLEDEHFVEMANDWKQRNISSELFNFQFTEKAIQALFPGNLKQILEDFVKMLILDAIVGNNDRHFYNWGVITDLFGHLKPRFSPIYDTARGLFWNTPEHRLLNPKDTNGLLSYIDKALPRTGWEGTPQINHFELIKHIFHEDGRYCEICKNILNDATFTTIERLIDTQFKELMSPRRLELIKKCLNLRIERLFLSLY